MSDIREFVCAGCHTAIPLEHQLDDQVCHCPACGYRYRWSNRILMLGDSSTPADYPDASYALLADAEPKHFWFAGRNQMIIATMRRVIGPLAGRSVLDIGCGTGFVLAALELSGMIACGLDMHLAGLRYARARTHGLLVCETATRVPFANQFDVAMLCDVIEHTSDDSAVLREASRALKPRGVIVITVPANPHMWTIVDEVSGHKRRYTRTTLAEAIQKADLRVRALHYFNSVLYPVQLFQRRFLKRRAISSDADRLDVFHQSLRMPPPLLNSIFRAAMAADVPLSRLALPIGGSLIAVAERSEQAER